ncbi:hypothetical protein OA90_06675 [Labrenzia sp. OB1]|nr:hypothetical protein OA90_06675 [Labrenzia sp. OB1]
MARILALVRLQDDKARLKWSNAGAVNAVLRPETRDFVGEGQCRQCKQRHGEAARVSLADGYASWCVKIVKRWSSILV